MHAIQLLCPLTVTSPGNRRAYNLSSGLLPCFVVWCTPVIKYAHVSRMWRPHRYISLDSCQHLTTILCIVTCASLRVHRFLSLLDVTDHADTVWCGPCDMVAAMHIMTLPTFLLPLLTVTFCYCVLCTLVPIVCIHTCVYRTIYSRAHPLLASWRTYEYRLTQDGVCIEIEWKLTTEPCSRVGMCTACVLLRCHGHDRTSLPRQNVHRSSLSFSTFPFQLLSHCIRCEGVAYACAHDDEQWIADTEFCGGVVMTSLARQC